MIYNEYVKLSYFKVVYKTRNIQCVENDCLKYHMDHPAYRPGFDCFHFKLSYSSFYSRQAIYRIRDNYRTVVGEYVWGNFDLSTCGDGGRTPYSDLSVRAGYMHSICMTENYIILPASGWLLDYCGMFGRLMFLKPLL